MQKWILGLLLALLAAAPVSAAAEDVAAGKLIWLPIGAKTVEVNGISTTTDVPAQIIGSRTMVPARFISETLGAAVAWDEKERRVTITLDGRTVVTWINKAEAMVNGAPKALDTAPVIVDGRTMVPLRFISENLGLTVGWDNAHHGVYVVMGSRPNLVMIRGFQFTPNEIKVKVGTPVIFFNLDQARHTVTADHLTFDSGNMSNGWAYTVKLDQPGTYSYFCDFHSAMTGTLIVEP